VGYTWIIDPEYGTTGIVRERRAEHGVVDAVRFDRSIEARSARIDSGFWSSCDNQ
jgi:hypothetical protein